MYRHLRSVLILLLCVSCLEPYAPAVDAISVNSLVVDGHLDADGSAIVKLTRALPLTSYADQPLEKAAVVTISSNTGKIFNLIEKEPGIYSAEKLAVDKQSMYTLHIRTSGGKEYESDVVRIHPTPDIDNVYHTFSASGEDLEIRTDSRDDNPNSTGYYLWESVETYMYHSTYFSRYKRENGLPVLRSKPEYVDTCWREVALPHVTLSTNRLSNNTISGKILTTINKHSPRISMRYSILARQRSISEQEYNYRVQLEKTTNEQGSIFAEIPGPVVSNVHSIDNPDEYVLGYFSGQEIKEKRIFIGHKDLPLTFQAEPFPEVCDLEGTCPTRALPSGPSQCVDVELLSESKIIISSYEFQNSIIYLFAPVECGDCTKKGGVTRMPDYW